MKAYFRQSNRLIALAILIIHLFQWTAVSAETRATTRFVSTLGTDNGACQDVSQPCRTIGYALARAGNADTIKVAMGTYAESTSPMIDFKQSSTLSGGWNNSFDAQTGISSLDGENARSGIRIAPQTDANFLIERFAIVRTRSDFMNPIWVMAGVNLTLTQVLIANNQTGQPNVSGGGGGAGVGSTGANLLIRDSAIVDNRIVGGFEGIALNLSGGKTTVVNTTIADNKDGRNAIYNFAGELNLRNVTVTGNNGGLRNVGGRVTLQNTVLTDNIIGYGNCQNDTSYGTKVTSLGFNVVGGGYGCDLVSTDIQPVALLNLTRVNAAIPYFALPITSTLIDAGDPSGCKDENNVRIDLDQNGAPRIDQCDIGAIEAVETFRRMPLQHKARVGDVITTVISFRGIPATSDPEFVTIAENLPSQLVLTENGAQADRGSVVQVGQTVSWTVPVSTTTSKLLIRARIAPDTPAWQTITWRANTTFRDMKLSVPGDVVLPPYVTHVPITQHEYCAGNFADNFNGTVSAWPSVDNNSFFAQVVAGEYAMRSKQGGFQYSVQVPACRPDEYRVAVDARVVAGSNATYGLIVDMSADRREYIMLEVAPDSRTYQILKRNADGSFTRLVGPSTIARINSGTTANRLKVTAFGNALYFSINDDGSIPGGLSRSARSLPGVALMMSSDSESPNTDVRFDNFEQLGGSGR